MKEELIRDGWNLTGNGIDYCKKEWGKSGKSPNQATARDIISIALNTDLVHIGENCIPDELRKGGLKKLPKALTLQVSKVKNLTAPMANQKSQHAPRMLQFHLSDGHRSCVAIEHQHMPQLNLDIAPGTKLHVTTDISISNSGGTLLMTPGTVKLLGGKVEALYKKWEASRQASGFVRDAMGDTGSRPPPFVPFGKLVDKRYDTGTKTDKLLADEDAKNEVDNADDDDEFAEQRRQRLKSVAIKIKDDESSKKKFKLQAADGKSLAQMADERQAAARSTRHPNSDTFDRLVQMGFQPRQVSRALRSHENQFEPALESLLAGSTNGDNRSRDEGDSGYRGRGGGRGGRGRRGGRGGRGGGHRGGRYGGDEDEHQGQADTKKTTLFDYLQPKLSTNKDEPQASASTASWVNQVDDDDDEDERMLQYALEISKSETSRPYDLRDELNKQRGITSSHPSSRDFQITNNDYKQHRDYNQRSNAPRFDRNNDHNNRPNSRNSSSYGRENNYNDRPNRYNNDRQSTYNDRPNSFNDRKSSYNDRKNTYNDKQNTYNDRQNTYHDRQNTYHDRQNTHNDRQNTYNDRQNTYNDRQNSYNNRQNSYNNRQNSYNNRQNSYNNRLNNDRSDKQSDRKSTYDDGSNSNYHDRQDSYNNRTNNRTDDRRNNYNSDQHSNRGGHSSSNRGNVEGRNRAGYEANRPVYDSKDNRFDNNSIGRPNNQERRRDSYNDESDRQNPYSNNSNRRQQKENEQVDKSESNRQQRGGGNQGQNNNNNNQKRAKHDSNYQQQTDKNNRQRDNDNKRNSNNATNNSRNDNRNQQQQHTTPKKPDMAFYQPRSVRTSAPAPSTSTAAAASPEATNLEFDRKLTLGETAAHHQQHHRTNKTTFGSDDASRKFQVGDLVAAQYWEDGQYYQARVIDVHESKPFIVVEFVEYGNCEELHASKVHHHIQQKQATSSTAPPTRHQPIRSAEFYGSKRLPKHR